MRPPEVPPAAPERRAEGGGRIGLVTDSSSQLPPELARRYGVEVVPVTVTVDGVAYSEGEDLDADAFWARFEAGTPAVSTSQPSPGRIAQAYHRVEERGAGEILSVHIGSSMSGTVNSARLAATEAGVPVRVVDTGTASFGVACCLWEAAEAIAAGASLQEAALVAEGVAQTVGMVFVVEALDLARAGGRLAEGTATGGISVDGAGPVPIMTLVEGTMRVVGRADDLGAAADAMAAHVLGGGGRLRVGIGAADAATRGLARALEDRLTGMPQVRELVHYRVGPSVGAHSGPGTVGAVYYPVRRGGPKA